MDFKDFYLAEKDKCYYFFKSILLENKELILSAESMSPDCSIAGLTGIMKTPKN